MMKTFALTLIALSLSPVVAHADNTTFSPQAAFITSDTDRSGAISLKEFEKFLQKAEGKSAMQASENFASLDKNQDGSLNLSEMQNKRRELLTPMR